jgi:hypothetical protein
MILTQVEILILAQPYLINVFQISYEISNQGGSYI